MGSKQQIVIGVSLLVCAFIFGRYLHSRPLSDNDEFVAALETESVPESLPAAGDFPESVFANGAKSDSTVVNSTSSKGGQQSLRERILGKRLAAEKSAPQHSANRPFNRPGDLFEPGKPKSLNGFKDEIVQPDFSNLAQPEPASLPPSAQPVQTFSESQPPSQPGRNGVVVGPIRPKPFHGSASTLINESDSKNPFPDWAESKSKTNKVGSVEPLRDTNTSPRPSSARTVAAAKSNLVRVQQPSHCLSIIARDFLTHKTQDGDTLHAISKKYYGKPDYYLDIYVANRDQLQNPSVVPKGLQLKIPVYPN